MTDSSEHASRSADERRSALPPPQFRLSTFLWIIAFLCGLFAVMSFAGPYAAFALTLFVLAVFAHVMGNAIGTRLRDGDPHDKESSRRVRSQPARKLADHDFAPATQLSQRRSLGTTVVVLTAVGAFLGGTVGGTVLILINWRQLNVVGIVFALLFTSVLGGFAGFAASSFVRVLAAAHHQALQNSDDQRRE